MKATIITSHLTAAAICTVMIGLIYAGIQQNYRMTANDPQTQIADDVSAYLMKGKSVDRFFKDDTIELSESLYPFVALYDKDGNVIRSTAVLNNTLLQMPKGVFSFAAINGENRVTWQPGPGVRMATVIKHISSPYATYVVAGRSLNEIEIRESNLIKMSVIGWVLCMALLIIHFIWMMFRARRIAV